MAGTDESDHDSILSESEDDDYYNDGDFEHDEGDYSCHQIHPVLAKDIELLKETYSPDLVSCRSLNNIHEMDVDIHLSTAVLERSVAEAWGLVPGLPVIVRLSFNQRHYLVCEKINKVEVFQKSSGPKTGILAQIKHIVEEFCRMQMRVLSNDIVTKAIEERQNLNQTREDIIPPKEDLKDLMEMGFCESEILCAYKCSNGTKEGAVTFLIDQEDALCADPSCANGATKLTDPKKAKDIPSLDKGFLVQFYSYIQKRFLTLNNYCPICDNPHHLAISVMLKPVVCNNPLCIFSFQTLGVMADAADTISTDTQVVHLLIRLTEAAVLSPRYDKILTPYPAVVHPTKINEMSLHEGNKDHKLLTDIVMKMPSIEKMKKLGEFELKELMMKAHQLCYPLLRWIISSNRSHIVLLPPQRQLRFMGTEHQFLMRNSPPLEDRRFRSLKQQHGSIFAFHGSPIENWHSIIREGLIVASGTHKQMHGAAYGKGIYLSPLLSTSFGYCRTSFYDVEKESKQRKKEKKSKLPGEYLQGKAVELQCLTLCEVINSSKVLKKHSNSIWTCDNSDYVCTRFFFVYDDQSPRAESGVDTTKAGYIEKIQIALEENMKSFC